VKIGITQYAASPDGRNFLERTAQMGLDGVEPFFGTADDELLSWSGEEIERFLLCAKRLGVCIPSTALGVFNNDPSLIDPRGRDRAVDLITRALRFTAAVEARTMLLCTYLQSAPDTAEKKANLLNVIRTVLPLADQLDVAVALESPLPAKELLDLLDATESDRTAVYYDLGNAVALGFDPAEEIRLLGRRILSVHVKDSSDSLGALHLGRGRLDLAASIEALKSIGYDGWLILETPGGDESSVYRDIEILKHYV